MRLGAPLRGLPKGIEAHYPLPGVTSVLLVVPRYSRGPKIPLNGVNYLAATLADRAFLRKVAAGSAIEKVRELEPPQFHVRVLDLSVAPEEFNLGAFLKGFSPTLLGVTANAHSIGAAFRIAELARRTFQTRDAIRIVGGYLPSAQPDFALEGGFQVAVVGWGEEPLAALALARHALGRGKFESALPLIPGAFYKEGKREIKGERKPPQIPLDELPFPHTAMPLYVFADYSDLAKIKQANVVSLRGCTNGCQYCSTTAVTLKRVSRRSPGNILAEIRALYAAGIRVILFDEEDFMLRPREEMTKLLAGLRSIKEQDLTFRWAMETRGDRSSLSNELIIAMASSGLKVTAFGVETLDESLARELKRTPGLSIARIEQATDTAKAQGVAVGYNLIVGTPGCGWREILSTALALVRKIHPFAEVATHKLYPGSQFYEESAPETKRAIMDWQRRTSDADTDYPIFDTAKMTTAEQDLANCELEMLLYCVGKTATAPETAETTKRWTSLILDAFRLSAMYDLFLNSVHSQQPRKKLLKNLSEEARCFFDRRQAYSANFSKGELWKDREMQRRFEQYRTILKSLNSFSPDAISLLDSFLQNVTIEGGVLLAGLSIQEMTSFVMAIANLRFLSTEACRQPFTRIIIEDEQGIFAAAQRMIPPDEEKLQPQVSAFLSGGINYL